MEPKITQTNLIESTYSSLIIEDSFFLFEFFVDGEPLRKYQQRVGKIFLTYSVYYEVYSKNGTYDRVTITLVDCIGDKRYEGYLCLDKSEVYHKNIFADTS